MKLIYALPAILLFCSAASHSAELPVKSVPAFSGHDGLIPQLPPGMNVMAGYITIRNNSKKPLVLTGFSSPRFKRVEAHQTVNRNGMLGMQKQLSLTVPAKSRLQLKPGGIHFMLIGPKRPLQLSETVRILCETGNKQKVTFELTVRPLSSTHKSGHHH